MAVLQREKEVFERMQKDSAQIRHKEQFYSYTIMSGWAGVRYLE